MSLSAKDGAGMGPSELARLRYQLERANRIIGWMMPYIGSMCPPQNGLGDLNDHCFENHIRPRMDDETKGPSIRQHAAGTRPSGVMPPSARSLPEKQGK